MNITQLNAISPIDGRYRNKVAQLANYFSEEALIKYRVLVEIEYFIALCEIPLPQLDGFDKTIFPELKKVYENFSTEDAQKIKDIEKVTNHDVKAVEYFIKEKFDLLGLEKYKEFIHFGLTSQDINNTAVPLSIKDAMNDVYVPEYFKVLKRLETLAEDWKDIPMLARTHGQPASPTRLGKEINVFVVRLKEQFNLLNDIPSAAKFGGATGNFNAHKVAYPNIDWQAFGSTFVQEKLGLHHSFPTTQIEHYDHMAALFDGLKRINTIVIDLDRDIWTYVSMEYFKQKDKGYRADHAYTIIQAVNLSPPIGSKIKKMYSAITGYKYGSGLMEQRGLDLTANGRLNLSPSYAVLGSLASGVANVPLDRMYAEIQGMSEMFDSRNTAYQRLALALGFRSWDVNAKNEEDDLIKLEAKDVRKKEGAQKSKKTREDNRVAREQKLSGMSILERTNFLRKEKEERKRKRNK